MGLKINEIHVEFGLNSSPVSEQLLLQGVEFSADQVLWFDKDIESINYLYYEDYLDDSQRSEMIHSLADKIISHIVAFNKKHC